MSRAKAKLFWKLQVEFEKFLSFFPIDWQASSLYSLPKCTALAIECPRLECIMNAGKFEVQNVCQHSLPNLRTTIGSGFWSIKSLLMQQFLAL